VKEILVYANWKELSELQLMGVLRAEMTKAEEVFSFEYSSQWLNGGFAQDIDPDLKLYQGPQYLKDEKPNFGLFLDSSPDRWGRLLMRRREAIKARERGKRPIQLFESDFLLGVHDETRMGGLRFKLNVHDEFLESNQGLKVPPMTSVRELEQASLRIEDDNFFEDKNARKWLNLLIGPGSSLGGARPKANVRETDGSLWIAKFPSKNDDKDSGIWEFLVNRMAKNIGIAVAEAKAARFSQRQHTFLSRRFDRSITRERIHFASAMTLLGYKDGYSHKGGGSYLEIAELIERFGASPDRDLIELWRRIVFSVGVSNTDDHLRNHGFLLTCKGWTLSPAYDINPDQAGIGLSLNISEHDNSLDFNLCLEVAEFFRWSLKEAKSYINTVENEISQWHVRAKQLQIPTSQINYMESAFVR